MKTLHPRRWLILLAQILFACLIAGCSDSNPDSAAVPTPTPAEPLTLTGVAAIGAPIAGGNVTVKGASGQPVTTTTSASGVYTVTLTGLAAPYVLQVSGGTVGGQAHTLLLHSVATSAGRANITTLTDLLVAALVRKDPATFFQTVGATGGDLTAISQTNITAAVETVTNLLRTIGVDITAVANFLTVDFQAVTGNPVDAVLDNLRSALTRANTTIAQLNAQLVSGATGTPPGPGSGAGAQCNELLVSGAYNLDYVNRLTLGTPQGTTTSETPVIQTLRVVDGAYQGEAALIHETLENGRAVSKSYFGISTGEYAIIALETFDPASGALLLTGNYSPRPRYPRSVSVGQTVSNAFTLTITGAAPSTTTVNEQLTLAAREAVTVAAGIFNDACKFTVLTTQRTTTSGITADVRNESTMWVGNGLARALKALKLDTLTTSTVAGFAINATTKTELVSGTVNGTRLP